MSMQWKSDPAHSEIMLGRSRVEIVARVVGQYQAFN